MLEAMNAEGANNAAAETTHPLEHLYQPEQHDQDENFGHYILIHTKRRHGNYSLETRPIDEFLAQENPPIQDDDDVLFQWYHLPVNHMDWAKGCYAKCFSGLLERNRWERRLRPTSSQDFPAPFHSRHIDPLVDEETAYIPYLNFELYGEYCDLRKTYPKHIPSGVGQRGYLARVLTRHGEIVAHAPEPSILHPRKTLDQFYYPSLFDTAARDSDQTISKWTGSGVGTQGTTHANEDSLLIMVDQLWLWMSDNKRVLSVFPSGNFQHSAVWEADLYSVVESGLSHRSSDEDLYRDIISKAMTRPLSPLSSLSPDIVATYRWAISQKGGLQFRSFDNFRASQGVGRTGMAALDDRQDLGLVLEVADIIEELSMMKAVTGIQRNLLAGRAESFRDVLQELLRFNDEISQLIKEAEGIRKSVLDLLDIMQKSATLAEARSTAQQGRAVMLFTIITVVFLPLSFFTSYFGQNVSEITGDQNNPTSWELWKIGMPISLVVILLALLVAYLITTSNSQSLFRRLRNRNRQHDIELARMRR